jgi:hypothetical protein
VTVVVELFVVALDGRFADLLDDLKELVGRLDDTRLDHLQFGL